jgi:ribosome biogenesis GTPase A
VLIQWYPGHMTKARRELGLAMPSQDVLVEVLDARLPASTENPVIAHLRREKPCLKVLAKADLADSDVTERWLRYLAARPDAGPVLAVAVSSERGAETRTRIGELCARLTERRPVRAMVLGAPNVGKSTLINTLKNRAVAATGNKPAVTKVQQEVVLSNGMILRDSPGILWPRIEDEAVSMRLAFAGSIPDTAIDYADVATFAARFLLLRYPDRLQARYKLAELPASAEALLDEIGRRRGGLRAGGVVDVHKAAEILVHDFRSAALGRISLEAPPT